MSILGEKIKTVYLPTVVTAISVGFNLMKITDLYEIENEGKVFDGLITFAHSSN